MTETFQLFNYSLVSSDSCSSRLSLGWVKLTFLKQFFIVASETEFQVLLRSLIVSKRSILNLFFSSHANKSIYARFFR